jgi:hypothetical protein
LTPSVSIDSACCCCADALEFAFAYKNLQDGHSCFSFCSKYGLSWDSYRGTSVSGSRSPILYAPLFAAPVAAADPLEVVLFVLQAERAPPHDADGQQARHRSMHLVTLPSFGRPTNPLATGPLIS